MNFLTLLTTGFLFLSAVFAEPEHCGTPCCGCDNKHTKSRIRTLTNQFLVDSAVPATRANALQLVLPDGPAFIQGEICRNGWYCCQWDTSITIMTSLLGSDAVASVWVEHVNKNHDGSYTAEAIVNYAYPTHTPPGGITFRFQINWIVTDDCNYKIKTLSMVSLACQIPVELPCPACLFG